MRKSPGVKIANLLDKFDAQVTAYDPQANQEATEDLRRSVTLCDSLIDAISECDAVVIATDWPEFTELSVDTLAAHLTPKAIVLDAVNAYAPQEQLAAQGLHYSGIGR